MLFYILGLNAVLIVSLFVSFLIVIGNLKFSFSIPRRLFLFSCFFIPHLFYSSYLNDVSAVFKYLVLYISLVSLWIVYQEKNNFLQKNMFSDKNIFNIIALLSLIQITHYFLYIFLSEAYTGISNIDPQARKSIGIYPVLLSISVLFFKNEFLSSHLRRLVALLAFIVPILVFFNGSRSELIFLIFAVFMGFFFRSPLGLNIKNLKYFFIALIIFLFIQPSTTDSLAVDRLFFSGLASYDLSSLLDFASESRVVAMQNFRAYESALILDKILNFNFLEIFIGCGIGCSIEYTYPLVLGDLTFYSSAVFHNGFLALILQFGMAGLIVSTYIITTWLKISWLIVIKKRFMSAEKFMSYLGHSFLVITMFTSGGYLSLISVCILFPLLYLPYGNKEFKNVNST